MHYYVFGDTGGHARLLEAGLEAIGWQRDSALLPAHSAVVHVGDLIHRGPDSLDVLKLVQRTSLANPGRWIQLMGNHEAQYLLKEPQIDLELSSQAREVLMELYEAKLLKRAWGLSRVHSMHSLSLSKRPYKLPNKPLLITHAGLTWGFQKRFLNPYVTMRELLLELEELPLQHYAASGVLLTGTVTSTVGPLWAHCVRELWSSWSTHDEPFMQLHGHSYPFRFGERSPSWWPGTATTFKSDTHLNPERRVASTRVGESLHVALDPGFGNRVAKISMQPHLLVSGEE